jgi:uncharacterized damage-inducible protein DinB
MQIRRLIPVVAALAFASPAAAQSQTVNSVKPLFDQIKGWIIASAEKVSEADYSFQPTPEVRTFGQLVGHVTDASYLFCSGAKGEASPSAGGAEALTSKAELVAAVKAAFAYCDSAYAMSDATAMESVEFFQQTNTRLWVLAFNVSHDFEHYGNMVTYMRMKGLVPPSSGG